MARFARQPALGRHRRRPSRRTRCSKAAGSIRAHPERLGRSDHPSSAEMLEVKLGDELDVARAMGDGAAPGGAEVARQGGGHRRATQDVAAAKIHDRAAAIARRGICAAGRPARPCMCRSRCSSEWPAARQRADLRRRRAQERRQCRGVSAALGRRRWPRLQPAVELQSLADVESEIDGSTTTEVVRTQALSATGIALLAALFIIYTTLSMGVHERIRQFAVLRAVALSKAHITAIIATESVVLGTDRLGRRVAGRLGLADDHAESFGPRWSTEDAVAGNVVHRAVGCVPWADRWPRPIAPAWQATRVSPLDAMAPRRRLSAGRVSGWATAVGLLLICLNPLLVFYVPMADTARYAWSAAIGCTSMAIGFLLLTPAGGRAVRAAAGPVGGDRLADSAAAAGDAIDARICGERWAPVWRLTLGPGAVRGHADLGLFDARPVHARHLGARHAGRNQSAWACPTARSTPCDTCPGVVPNECLPLAVKQVKFADDVTGFEVGAVGHAARHVRHGRSRSASGVGRRASRSSPFSSSPEIGPTPSRNLRQGRFCLVPDHFARESGFGRGGQVCRCRAAAEPAARAGRPARRQRRNRSRNDRI